jgi:hypothetical protein
MVSYSPFKLVYARLKTLNTVPVLKHNFLKVKVEAREVIDLVH